MKNDNVDAVVSKMEAHFKRWSRRSLTTLGKVLIVKSFGKTKLGKLEGNVHSRQFFYFRLFIPLLLASVLYKIADGRIWTWALWRQTWPLCHIQNPSLTTFLIAKIANLSWCAILEIIEILLVVCSEVDFNTAQSTNLSCS